MMYFLAAGAFFAAAALPTTQPVVGDVPAFDADMQTCHLPLDAPSLLDRVCTDGPKTREALAAAFTAAFEGVADTPLDLAAAGPDKAHLLLAGRTAKLMGTTDWWCPAGAERPTVLLVRGPTIVAVGKSPAAGTWHACSLRESTKCMRRY